MAFRGAHAQSHDQILETTFERFKSVGSSLESTELSQTSASEDWTQARLKTNRKTIMPSRSQGQTFIDVLAEELRDQIRAELRREMALERDSTHKQDLPSEFVRENERLELWLRTRWMSGQDRSFAKATRPTGPKTSTRFGADRSACPGINLASLLESQDLRAAIATATRSTHANAKQTPHVRRVQAQDALDAIGVEFFRRYGASLQDEFSEAELKAAYRKVALKVHPDRHPTASPETQRRMAAAFQDLQSHSARLARLFKTQAI